MTETKWKNPNSFFLALRCMEKQYADTFISHGRLKFNTPKVWEEWSKKGRGDIYEGTLAFCNKRDSLHYEQLKNEYPEAYQYDIGNRVLLKDQRDMNLPCLCLGTVKQKTFTIPTEPGIQKISAIIEGQYFKDFADNLTVEEVAKLPLENQPALVAIRDFDEFLERLKRKLTSMGLQESQILVQHISYMNFSAYGGDDSWMDFKRELPKELFVKSDEFSYQSELRIIINTDNPAQLKMFENPIDIGKLSDIAIESVGYHPDGIIVEGKVGIEITD